MVPSAGLLITLGLAVLLWGCAPQPYPPNAPPKAPQSAPQSAPEAAIEAEAAEMGTALPVAPDESEVFLAVRQIAKRGPTRDLRSAAFRYMSLRFSSGTLASDGTADSAANLAAPLKVSEEAKLGSLDRMIAAVVGLPADSRAAGQACLADYEPCAAAVPGLDAPHCSGPMLICLADSVAPGGEES